MKSPELITSCKELTPSDMRTFAEDRSSTAARDLLERLELIARPDDGAGIILYLLAAIALRARWLPDRLNVAFTVAGSRSTKLDLTVDSGGLRERLWRRYRFAVPIREFETLSQQLCGHAKMPFEFTFRRDGQRLTGILMQMDRPVRAMTVPPDRQAVAKEEPVPSSRPLETGDIDSSW